MVNIAIVGSNGKMGGFVARAAEENDACQTLFGVDAYGVNKNEFPVYKDFESVESEKPDVLVDFSNPAALDGMLDYAVKNNIPCVICTTGYTSEQIESIKKASEKVAIFFSGNMSLGINLLIELSKQASRVLGGSFDIEIVEKHHNLKVDAPSGTAKTLIQAIDPKGECQLVYGREGNCGARTKKEIGVHAVRGGTMVGEHKVDFFGTDEVFEITHKMGSRQILVDGAIGAGKRLLGKAPGFYTMDDLLFG